MHISKTTSATLEQSNQLTILHNIAKKFTGFGIISNGSAWHIDYLAFAIGASTFIYAAILTISGKNMTLILKMKQCPVITVTTQDDITTLAAVTTIGTAIRYILCTMQVSHSATSATRTAHNLYIIDKI